MNRIPETKRMLAESIRGQVIAFLSSGGEIRHCEPGETGEEFILKRTKKQQVEWCRKKLRVRRG